MKAYGISCRVRLFEVIQQVEKINAVRERKAPNRQFVSKSNNDVELKEDRSLKLSYIAVLPRMALFIKYSTKIYNNYKNFIDPEDTHVYYLDEVFMDVTNYLKAYRLTVHKHAAKIIKEVFKQTGITVTAGIGINLYLCTHKSVLFANEPITVAHSSIANNDRKLSKIDLSTLLN